LQHKVSLKAAVLGGVLRENPAPGTAQGAPLQKFIVNKKTSRRGAPGGL
jgi:hypothetical protein